jgi:hypothetical protein
MKKSLVFYKYFKLSENLRILMGLDNYLQQNAFHVWLLYYSIDAVICKIYI